MNDRCARGDRQAFGLDLDQAPKIGTSVLRGGAAVEVVSGAELVKGEGCEVIRQSDSGCLGSIYIAPEVSLSYTCLGSSIDHLQGDTGVPRPPALGNCVEGGAYEGV